MSRFVGIDLGGTKIAAIAYDANAQSVVKREVIPTDGKEGADGVIRQMIELVRKIAKAADWTPDSIAGVGVGVPAVVDYEKGHTTVVPNIPGNWVNKPVTDPMQEALQCAVYLINDARAFILAEARLGAGQGYPIVAGMTWGTGIGGGIIIDGNLLLGLNGSAGEFGHITIDFNGLPDGTGTPGGLESYGSGPAIESMAGKAINQGIDTKIAELVDYDLNKITPAIVAQAADDGDELALSIFEYIGKTVGAGMANVVTVINPHVLVIGGGVANLGDRVIEPLREGLRTYNKTANIDDMKIVRAEVDDAGAVGAALWAQQNVGDG